MVKLSSADERRNISRVRNLLFSKVINGEKDRVMMVLMSVFGRLTYEELEEVYGDGCLVLWNKLEEGVCRLEGNSMVTYLIRVCKNIGMHYLRKVRDDMDSLDELMSRSGDCVGDEDGLMKVFDVIDEGGDEEKDVFKKLDEVWEKLSDVDVMILDCYYNEGCKMDEIARRVGYRSADSVKSRKNKILRKMYDLMKKEEGSDELPSSFSINERCVA